jgi:GntR family transcriptional regulator/MocR family aminotransferase
MTILTAYDQLKADGYIETLPGGGTRISKGIPSSAIATHGLYASRGASSRANAKLSALAAKMVAAVSELSPHLPSRQPIPFVLGVPALDAFPVEVWARLMARRWRTTPRLMLSPDDGAGFAPLRQAIAEYVVAARAVRCTAEQIVITAGAQQAIDLLARLLLNPGDAVWVEEYGYVPARAAFASVGATPVQIPVDDEGLDVEWGQRTAPAARVAFVTPACGAPYGVTMSLRRRLALLDWAHETSTWIIEDDYNGELRYEGKPLAALQGLQHPGAERVIYLRTFSKTLFPALRLGYAVLPFALLDAFTRARVAADRHSPIAEQAVLADFMTEGHFARHVRNMRDLYAERQRAFLHLASAELGDLLQFRSAPAGLRLVGRLQPGMSDQRVAMEAARRGLIVDPLSAHTTISCETQGLVFGYAPFGSDETRRALGRLAEVLCSARSA